MSPEVSTHAGTATATSGTADAASRAAYAAEIAADTHAGTFSTSRIDTHPCSRAASTMCVEPPVGPGATPTRGGEPAVSASALTIHAGEGDTDSNAANIRVVALPNSVEVFGLRAELAHLGVESPKIGSGAGAYPPPGIGVRVGGNTNAPILVRIEAPRGRHRVHGGRFSVGPGSNPANCPHI